MKKIICAILVVCMFVTLASCNNSNNNTETTFKPSLDTNTTCDITIVGNYDNFEALEAEFDRFNEYYPNVSLQYVKLDDYNNSLSTVLKGNEKPNIFFSYTWMIGNSTYDSVYAHMENLSDTSLKLNLNCIRPGLLNKDSENRVYMVPVFSRTYGMLINSDLFEKEGLSVPKTWSELLSDEVSRL